MQKRTDLALEQREEFGDLPDGVECEEFKKGDALVTKIIIKNSEGARALQKPIGTYLTVEVPPFTDNLKSEELIKTVAENLSELIKKDGSALVVGLGNRVITPDALGPKAALKILATRQIGDELRRVAGIEKIRDVSVLAPGVLGQTGIEVFDLLNSLSKEIKPDFIIVIDALASRYLKRLGCTIQMSNTGITPGAGVGNARHEISKATLGVDVIAVGVPTVVDAATLVYDLTGMESDTAKPDGREMIVTPREIDLLIDRASSLVAESINRALFFNIEPEIIKELLS
ncbi:MAG: GPR endopeptidase [Clostridia bacterium]|nr:GPR endopeptidase [Clostridia bacterium]